MKNCTDYKSEYKLHTYFSNHVIASTFGSLDWIVVILFHGGFPFLEFDEDIWWRYSLLPFYDLVG